jgi:NAD(P)-dependent dehydrogenase (short-subunit alcohol dehydrogenase family)
VIDSIKEISPSTTATFVQIDLSSIASVRATAAKVVTLIPHVDVLINNAAIMALPTYHTAPETKDVELQFASNHVGHFLLTNLLLPLFPASGEARIVNVSSEGHAFVATTPLESLAEINYAPGAGREYDEWEAYGMSKAANMLFTRSLAARLDKQGKGIKTYSLHPGNVISTNLAESLSDVSQWQSAIDKFAALSQFCRLPFVKTKTQMLTLNNRSSKPTAEVGS